jgi:hypothetical protein
MQMILNKGLGLLLIVESNNGYKKTDKISVFIFEVIDAQTI